jgi:hypothetical protein
MHATRLIAALMLGVALPVLAQDPAPTGVGGAQMQQAIAGPGPNRRVQVFSESFSGGVRGPFMINLDSGATYSIYADLVSDTVTLALTVTPRSGGAPVVFDRNMFRNRTGQFFTAPATGTYRIETAAYGGRDEFQVRIYREPTGMSVPVCPAGTPPAQCQATAPKHGFHITPFAVIMTVGFLPLLFTAMMRGGKSF